MKANLKYGIIISGLLLIWRHPCEGQWMTATRPGYKVYFTAADKASQNDYADLATRGISTVQEFFNSSFIKNFECYIHPDRKSLDSTWQHNWNMPDFKSQCWMVASGVADRLDLVSPAHWETEACEHDYSDKDKTQRLITHELVHVFHGQHNASPDFSATEGIDWFVEGLATYASGQCDSLRIAEVRKAIADNKVPAGLDNFWTGKLRYGLSGSMVMFIDKKYGRQKIKDLLSITKKPELLLSLGLSEEKLIEEWKKYMLI
jgi:hypothetical protein